MQFQDELAGGVVLIRPALQSPDYVAGASGWAIKVDGSAEFNNITIRGSGSADPLVVGPDGAPQVIIRTTPTNGLIVFPTNRPIENDAATLNSAVVNSGAADERAELQMTGPTVTGATGGVRLVLRSQPNNGSLPAEFSVQDRAGTTTYFAVDNTEVRIVERRIDSRQLAATDVVLAGYVTTDAFDRVRILANGEIQWGPGSGARDVNLYRGAADVLQTDDTFVVLGEFHPRNLVRGTRGSATDSQFETRQTGDGFARWFVRANGETWWGSGAAVQDVRLYRSAAGVLTVGGTFSADNFPAGAWGSWTPTWTTSSGANLPSFGNATISCTYTQFGKTVLAKFEVVFGTTTNFGAAPTTGDNWRFSLPVTAASTIQAAGWLEINAGTAARAICRARCTTTTAFEMEFSTGLTDGSNPVNKGLVDSLTPFTWASGDSVRGTLMYEAA